MLVAESMSRLTDTLSWRFEETPDAQTSNRQSPRTAA
jgi:hypothetical protein